MFKLNSKKPITPREQLDKQERDEVISSSIIFLICCLTLAYVIHALAK